MATKYPEGFEPIAKSEYPEGFEPIKSLDIVPKKPIGQIEEEIGLLGGTGQPMSREEAINLSRQRFVDRSQLEGQPNIQLMDGKVVDTNQLSTLGKALLSVPRAFSSGQTFGLTDTAEKGLENALLATGLTTPEVVNALGVGSQRSQEGVSDVLSGLAGGLATGTPTAKAISQSPGLLRKTISGGSTGAQAGALSELNRQLSEGQPIDAGQIARSATLTGLLGGAIPLGVQGTVSAGRALGNSGQIISNISKNRAPATFSEIAENALDFTPEQVAEHVPIAVARTRQIIGKEIPKTAQEGVSLLDKAEKELYSQRQDINKAADNSGLVVNGNQAIESARSALDEIKTITQSEKNSILKKVEELYSGEKKPTEGQLVQEQLNAKLKAFFSSEDPIATAQQKVDLAIRNSYAGQMDQINQAMTGRAESPYSDIGNIIETRNALVKKLDQIRMSEADKKGGIGKGPTKIPTSVYGAKAQGVNAVLSNLQKNQLTKLNEATKRIFSEGNASIVSPEIPAATLDELIKSKTGVGSNLDRLLNTLPKNAKGFPLKYQQQIADAIQSGNTNPAP